MRGERNTAIFSPQCKDGVSFDLDAEQVAKANQWAIRHRCSRRGMYGSAGEKCHFTFCPSGIGNFVAVHCSCGKSLDITGNL